MQKSSDQIVAKLLERLKSQGYEVKSNATLRGKSGNEHIFDYLLLRRDAFVSLTVAVEVISDAEDPETSLHRLFTFQDKCSDCEIKRCVVIAIPRLSFVAGQFARKDGIDVFDEVAVQMLLARPPALRSGLREIPLAFRQKIEVNETLRQLGYRVEESAKVVGNSGSTHVFSAVALWDDGFILYRVGIDYLASDKVDKEQVGLFDDKCADARITEKILLVSGEITEDAKKFAQQKKVHLLSLGKTGEEVTPSVGVLSPQAGDREDAKQEKIKGPGAVAEQKEAAIPSSTPAKGTAGQKGSEATEMERLPKTASPVAESVSPKTVVEKAVEQQQKKAAESDRVDTEAKPAAPAEELPSRARSFSMRSVIDQFFLPRVRTKQTEKEATPDGTGKSTAVANEETLKVTATVVEPAMAQINVAEAKVPAVRAGELGLVPPGDKPAVAEVRGAGAKAVAAKPMEAKVVSGAGTPPGTPAKMVETKGSEAKPAEPRPSLAADKLGVVQLNPTEAKVVPVTGKPGAAQGDAGGTKVVDVKPTVDKVPPQTAGAPKVPKPVVDKTGQVKVAVPETISEVAVKQPSGQTIDKEGAVDKSQAAASIAGQSSKLAAEKPSVDKRAVPIAQTKASLKPPEPPKPVVEQVVEKPKVKLRKAARPEALQLIPEATARKFVVLPISVTDNVLEVAMVNPSDLVTIQVLEHQSKMRVRAVAAERQEILEAIDFNYKGFGQIAEQISHIDTGSDAVAGPDLVAATANAPVAAALNLIVEEAVKARASDIHIEPEEKRLRIRYRIDGVLHEVMSLPIKIHPPLTSRVKVMSDLNIADHLRPQDGQFSLEVKGKSVDVRVATSPTVHGETVVMRILDKSVAVMELPQLGFSADSLEKFQKMLAVPFGMICVSGPTGAGKTTTLYAALNTLDKTTRNIITVEDPVEYRFEGMKQIQVNPKAGLTFASALRSMMRLDPDVILVGEIRDAETASIAVKAALTGHLVLCSIHANDAIGVVYRLLDLGVEPFMVASVITGTLAQRMARRVCTNCAAETKPTPAEAAAFESATGEKLETFLSGSGCDLCSYSGYKGRLGLFEILTMSDVTRAMILRGATTAELRNQAIKEGMVPLLKDGMLKVKAGLTTVSEVLRNAYSID